MIIEGSFHTLKNKEIKRILIYVACKTGFAVSDDGPHETSCVFVSDKNGFCVYKIEFVYNK